MLFVFVLLLFFNVVYAVHAIVYFLTWSHPVGCFPWMPKSNDTSQCSPSCTRCTVHRAVHSEYHAFLGSWFGKINSKKIIFSHDYKHDAITQDVNRMKHCVSHWDHTLNEVHNQLNFQNKVIYKHLDDTYIKPYQINTHPKFLKKKWTLFFEKNKFV